MEKISFSVITVCLDNLSGLKATYLSLKEQVYRRYEWIVIDGGSKDGTPEWLMSLNAGDIRWVSEPDKGPFDAMNKGIDRATGDYLVFMNSSDLFADPEVLKSISDEIEGSRIDAAFLYGDSLDFLENGKTFYRKARKADFLVNGMFTHHQSMYFNRNRLGGLRYDLDFPLTADYAFIGSFMMKGEDRNILYLNRPLCRFRLGGINEKRRFNALKEEYSLRRRVFKISAEKAGLLFLLHVVHTTMKRIAPSLVRKIRYD